LPKYGDYVNNKLLHKSVSKRMISSAAASGVMKATNCMTQASKSYFYSADMSQANRRRTMAETSASVQCMRWGR